MPPPYMNRTWLQGTVASTPTVNSLSPRTKLTSFQLCLVESWVNPDGEIRARKNRILVEVVGKDSERVAFEAKLGSWVTLEGYIRSEQFKGQELVKVRTLSIDIWGSQHAERVAVDDGSEA
jgi:single-stranded DNA-binding protein